MARRRPRLLALSISCWPFNPSPSESQAARKPMETVPAASLRKSRRLIRPSSVTVPFLCRPSDLSRPQHTLGLALELPNPLLRYPQLVGQLREGRSLFLVEPVPLDQDVPMALR